MEQKHTAVFDEIIRKAVGHAAPAVRALIRHNRATVYNNCSGWLDPETRTRPVKEDTLFDLASVSKLFTALTFMALAERGIIQLDQPVCSVLPDFSGRRPIQPYDDPLHWGEYVQPKPYSSTCVDAGKVTFRQLLSHNSGLPAWLRFKDQPDAEAARQLALSSSFFYPTGSRVVYSDVGLILTGMAIEKLTGCRLDEAVQTYVLNPLGLTQTRYLPLDGQPYKEQDIAPSEYCRMRKYRVVGEVHDESAWRLGGVAGHAGLFSTAPDIARLGDALLADGVLPNGGTLLNKDTIKAMTAVQAEDGDMRRGIGFMLRSPSSNSFTHPFNPGSFGHTGFTGTSLWVDPQDALVIVLLTNRVYYGRDAETIGRLRVEFHRAAAQLYRHSTTLNNPAVDGYT